MSLLNTGLNAIGTVAALKSLVGSRPSSTAAGKMNNFISEVRNRSVARTNLFDVSLSIPPVMNGRVFSAIGPALSLWAESSQLPGFNVQTDSVKRYGIGPQESVPYSIQTNDLTFNFIGDGKGAVQKYFYEWMHRIVRGDEDVRAQTVSGTGLAPYEVEFKDQYACTITITSYNEQGQPVLIYELYDAFPKTMPDISMSWNDNSSFMQFGVTFSYLRARLTNSTQPLRTTKNGVGSLSTLQKAIKVGTALQTIASLKRPRSIQDALSSATTIKGVTSAFR